VSASAAHLVVLQEAGAFESFDAIWQHRCRDAAIRSDSGFSLLVEQITIILIASAPARWVPPQR
jgi:hypothetical protein